MNEDIIDQAEAILAKGNIIEFPIIHRFADGLYIREIFMPAGSLLTSKIHKTEHPFIISKGKVNVWIDGVVHTYEAPYCGITKPGTRRVLYILEDCVWTTIHRNDDNERDPLVIENRIIEAHDNELLPEELKLRFNLSQKIKNIKP